MEETLDDTKPASMEETANDDEHYDDSNINGEVPSIRQYIDRFQDPITDTRLFAETIRATVGKKLVISLMGRRVNFPRKLYELLNDAAKYDFDHVVSWRHHGRAFQIYDKVGFEREILPRYFGASQYGSFVRQLYLYNFTKITTGADTGSHFHERLLRGRPDLATDIARKTRGGKRREIVIAPDFNALPRCGECFEGLSSQLIDSAGTPTEEFQPKNTEDYVSTKLSVAFPQNNAATNILVAGHRLDSKLDSYSKHSTHTEHPLLSVDGNMPQMDVEDDKSLSPLRKFHFENGRVCQMGRQIDTNRFHLSVPLYGGEGPGKHGATTHP